MKFHSFRFIILSILSLLSLVAAADEKVCNVEFKWHDYSIEYNEFTYDSFLNCLSSGSQYIDDAEVENARFDAGGLKLGYRRYNNSPASLKIALAPPYQGYVTKISLTCRAYDKPISLTVNGVTKEIIKGVSDTKGDVYDFEVNEETSEILVEMVSHSSSEYLFLTKISYTIASAASEPLITYGSEYDMPGGEYDIDRYQVITLNSSDATALEVSIDGSSTFTMPVKSLNLCPGKDVIYTVTAVNDIGRSKATTFKFNISDDGPSVTVYDKYKDCKVEMNRLGIMAGGRPCTALTLDLRFTPPADAEANHYYLYVGGVRQAELERDGDDFMIMTPILPAPSTEVAVMSRYAGEVTIFNIIDSPWNDIESQLVEAADCELLYNASNRIIEARIPLNIDFPCDFEIENFTHESGHIYCDEADKAYYVIDEYITDVDTDTEGNPIIAGIPLPAIEVKITPIFRIGYYDGTQSALRSSQTVLSGTLRGTQNLIQVQPVESQLSLVQSILSDVTISEPEYFTPAGIKVVDPTVHPGVYIKRQGVNVTKIVVN